MPCKRCKRGIFNGGKACGVCKDNGIVVVYNDGECFIYHVGAIEFLLRTEPQTPVERQSYLPIAADEDSIKAIREAIPPGLTVDEWEIVDDGPL